jgi:predicted nucleotidyltransferase
MAKNIYNKVIELIFERPSYHFHLRELARLVKVHPNSIKTAALELKKEGIVRFEKKKHLSEIFADSENKNFAKNKRKHNFMAIYDSGIVESIAELLNPESISIIGSYSRGEDIENSDIDIVVIKPKGSAKAVSLEKFEDKLKRKIHLIVSDYKGMSDEFYINLINGMLLYGYLGKK